MRKKTSPITSQTDLRAVNEAIEHFRKALASGKHWYIALLEAIGLWSAAEEDHSGRHYLYLIDNEAFDWLLLAERLCQEMNGLIPEEEMLDLLLLGKAPIELSTEEFRQLMGETKYRAHLNYLYGVTVEEALFLAVEEEINKEHRALVYHGRSFEDAYQRIYGASQDRLLSQFRDGKGYPQGNDISLTELREFTYWLFKYRLKQCDKARVASDTKKALEKLRPLRQRLAQPSPQGPLKVTGTEL